MLFRIEKIKEINDCEDLAEPQEIIHDLALFNHEHDSLSEYNQPLNVSYDESSIANVVIYIIFLFVRSCRSLHDLARPFQPVVFSTSFREISHIKSKHTDGINFHNTT